MLNWCKHFASSKSYFMCRIILVLPTYTFAEHRKKLHDYMYRILDVACLASIMIGVWKCLGINYHWDIVNS